MKTTESAMQRWVANALAYSDMNQQQLATKLSEHSARWTGARAKVNKITKGTQMLRADELYDIAAVTGYPIPAVNDTGNMWKDKMMEAIEAAFVLGANKDEVTLQLAEAFRAIDALSAADDPERARKAELLARTLVEPSHKSDTERK